ncbi:MAG: RNA-binding protein [Candidatus Entotheonella gemina]|uniref:RNA-binding protein n=1 Tax=Candidatus Entotheonella gemina TaxID=1429439 RepID=W4L4D2_9BACT|nr:MAG: RNA-binding protein [Candidatus Entotheonella gemina]
MSVNIYVGNLPFKTDEDEVRALFETYGDVDKVNLITDRETGRLRGFGFVEMSKGGEKAIEELNGSEFGGRNITVNPARPREEREQRRPRY